MRVIITIARASNSLSLSVAVWTVEFLGFHKGSGPAQQIHTCHEGQHMGAAQQEASGINTEPHCNASFTKSYFFNPLLLFCYTSYVFLNLSPFMTSHTCLSILLLVCCTFLCQLCMYEQFLGLEDHPGLGHTTVSR